jgi:putative hydrolase of the HAD superfamily
MERAVILADADNTLWDTDAVFADAQSRLLEAVERATGLNAPATADERVAWLRSYDEAIATIDHRHLRYPPSFLVRALAMGLAGSAPADAASAAVRGGATAGLTDHGVQAIAEAFLQALERVPEILPGVREGLEAAAREGISVWVLTEGSAERQRARIAAHGLDGLIRGVAEVTKNKEQFSRHQRRFAPRILYVIGDQPDRDVAPARAAGCRAVLVPSRFRPEWHQEAAWCDADNISETFDAAVGWVVSDLSERAPGPSRVGAR